MTPCHFLSAPPCLFLSNLPNNRAACTIRYYYYPVSLASENMLAHLCFLVFLNCFCLPLPFQGAENWRSAPPHSIQCPEDQIPRTGNERPAAPHQIWPLPSRCPELESGPSPLSLLPPAIGCRARHFCVFLGPGTLPLPTQYISIVTITPSASPSRRI